ncbi:MAG: hypothetical protein L0Y72_20935 [Gemmataceae bacterium]|nr:hypothetical protein [Gemmataceae bacterium]MCI0741507.1 hypothetical protein [Gemmataceae bacterium]
MTAADLHRAVETTLASKRLGTPVFVRYHFHAVAKRAIARLAQVSATVGVWLNQPLERIHAVGSVKEQRIHLTLEYRNGATALLSWAGAPASADGIDLTVLGNHGAIYHDAGAANLWDDPAQPAAEEADKERIAWIERALRSGRPEGATTPLAPSGRGDGGEGP